MAEQPQESSDKNVEIWKIKKLIKSLEAARGFVSIVVGQIPLCNAWIRSCLEMEPV